nr:Fur family transcriptional regulator [Conexibacter sp. DBS9H8]
MEELLRAHDLRVTRPRLAVLAVVNEHPHADTHAILDRVREQLPEVSHQAVYDVLAALSGAGVLRRIQPQGSVARYEARVGDNHHHVVCRACGAVADVDCAVGEAPCLSASDTRGYAIEEAEVIYWGLCPDCLAASGEISPPGENPAPGEDPGRSDPETSTLPPPNPRKDARV